MAADEAGRGRRDDRRRRLGMPAAASLEEVSSRRADAAPTALMRPFISSPWTSARGVTRLRVPVLCLDNCFLGVDGMRDGGSWFSEAGDSGLRSEGAYEVWRAEGA